MPTPAIALARRFCNQLSVCVYNPTGLSCVLLSVSALQDELDTVVQMWNNHRIRPGRNGCDLYHGKPVMMYNVPELYHAQIYLHPVEMDIINTVLGEDICQWKTDIPCDIDLHDLCLLVMEQHNLTRCHDAEGAIKLYKDLRPLIKALLEEPDE